MQLSPEYSVYTPVQYTCKVAEHCLGASIQRRRAHRFWTTKCLVADRWTGALSSPGPLVGPFVPTRQQPRTCWLLICISWWMWWSWAAFQLLPCQFSGFHLFLYLPALTTAPYCVSRCRKLTVYIDNCTCTRILTLYIRHRSILQKKEKKTPQGITP
ncbi:uncharacterized protein EURHEDRAFT_244543 [Aspergillus ruber CBS 135680]|uniref:Uncharacterized protein n=1 Tax=Aspergillus ruber (strain CBS 135680) TaxID=1388766 RepID=A0A017S324_ASPRC|nr:uncharacterized protein EURHEDRAFT_244543 [Aspergillus ruber CBS 135680]EYE91433.1 hypothetical protein EURHEDRAFT_244543 [Aspergillus ruber CBS 135680]